MLSTFTLINYEGEKDTPAGTDDRPDNRSKIDGIVGPIVSALFGWLMVKALPREDYGFPGEGPSDIETTHSAEGRQQAGRSYRDVYKKYKKESDAVLDSEPIPLGQRQTIRKYFEGVMGIVETGLNNGRTEGLKARSEPSPAAPTASTALRASLASSCSAAQAWSSTRSSRRRRYTHENVRRATISM